MPVRFDGSLEALVQVMCREIGASAVQEGIFVRDATGLLAVVLDLSLGSSRLSELDAAAREVLGGYARSEDTVRDADGVGSERLLRQKPTAQRFSVAGVSIAFIDRRQVGADWLYPPVPAAGIPRIAFASLKGGVGRSTALAVLAAYLSGRGLRVLAVDLDLEAPGIGTMLVQPEALPRFGTLDYLVENGISGIDDNFIVEMSGKSYLGSYGGQVTVLPAIGTETINNPHGALAKISRAYLEDVKEAGGAASLSEQVGEMVNRFTATGDYDVVLVDGRAGLHETTAAVLLGLGAEILFFGIDEPQTYLGYRLLLSHLAGFEGPSYRDWQQRIQFVQAKSSVDPEAQKEAEVRFAELYKLFSFHKLAGSNVTEVIPKLTSDDFDMQWSDDEPDNVEQTLDEDTMVLRVLDDKRYDGFNPIRNGRLLTAEVFTETFRDLLEWAESVIPLLRTNDDVD